MFERDNEPTLFLYVSNKYRRMRIGTKLVEINRVHFGQDFYVSRHDSKSKAFFDSVDA